MLARLWWKEWRAFGPIWLILILAAGGAQWWISTVQPVEARSGVLTLAALLWAVIYAFLVGSAAFAGEWDAKTMGFLDALPIGRPRLWLGKATFALLSTVGLASVLVLLAALGTTGRDAVSQYRPGELARVFGTLLFEGVAWGLFWSSLTRNPLVAGAMSIVSVYASTVVVDQIAAPNHLLAVTSLVAPDAFPWRILAASMALVASALALTYRERFTFPSVAPARISPRSRRRPRVHVFKASAGRSLGWQARREGLTTGALVLLLGLGVPIASRMLITRGDGPFDLFAVVLAYLTAGVAVFGADRGSTSPRFLMNHGVRPGLVWGRRLRAWVLPMAGFLGCTLLLLTTFGPANGVRPPALGQEGSWTLMVASVLIDAFAVGLVCGMSIPRRITAVLVGVIGLVALSIIQIPLVVLEMVPAWTLLLTPAILLGASRAWVGDWMAERDGYRPWLRLGLQVIVPLGMLVPAFIAWRAWGVADVGPQYVAGGAIGNPTFDGQDALPEYGRVIGFLQFHDALLNSDPESNIPLIDRIIERGWEPGRAEAVEVVGLNGPALAIARKAASLPVAAFEAPGPMPLDRLRDPVTQNLPFLAQLLALEARERQHRGDLAGAWEDILAQLRMADQLATALPTIRQLMTATIVHHRGVGLALEWAGDPRQTAETIRRARDDLRRLPPLPPAVETLRVESLILDRSFELPAEDLEGLLRNVTANQRWFSPLIAPWWERIRARRVCRELIAEMLPDAAREPWQRSADANFSPVPVGSPLAKLILPSFWNPVFALDRESVRRRALEQVLAIRSWQFAHDGRAPEGLAALVPAELDRLPLDPFSGRPFGYVRSQGQPARMPVVPDLGRGNWVRPTRPGQFILYSVGSDRADGGGEKLSTSQDFSGDELFPVP